MKIVNVISVLCLISAFSSSSIPGHLMPFSQKCPLNLSTNHLIWTNLMLMLMLFLFIDLGQFYGGVDGGGHFSGTKNHIALLVELFNVKQRNCIGRRKKRMDGEMRVRGWTEQTFGTFSFFLFLWWNQKVI